MTVAGLVKSSVVDFPGLVACGHFVPGCNYDCLYCHNRSLLDGTYKAVDPGETWRFLVRRAGLLDGVVLSGGEPTLQEGLIPFLQKIRGLGYKIKLDTNGSSPAAVRELLKRGLCDYFAVDYKAPAARYREIAGPAADAAAVLETVGLLLGAGAAFEVRTTLIPQLGREDFLRMAFELPPLPRYALNPYRPPEKFLPRDRQKILAERPYTRAEMDLLAADVRAVQPHAFL
jgi:pyruvate formate lyase activating enzyme